MANWPKKLREDAIIEALLEIRFDQPDVGELFLGRFIDDPIWIGAPTIRLPAADIPQPVRLANPMLRYQPTMEVRPQGEQLILRLGANVASIHSLAPYKGWDAFSTILESQLKRFFSISASINITRLSLRYINAVTPDRHGIKNISELNLDVVAAGNKKVDSFFLHYIDVLNDKTSAVVRILSPQFVMSGNIPNNTTALIDIDVSTPDGFVGQGYEEASCWLQDARHFKNDQFFGLLTKETIESLR